MSNLKENNYFSSPTQRSRIPDRKSQMRKKMSIIIPRTQIIIDYNYPSNLKERKKFIPLHLKQRSRSKLTDEKKWD